MNLFGHNKLFMKEQIHQSFLIILQHDSYIHKRGQQKHFPFQALYLLVNVCPNQSPDVI